MNMPSPGLPSLAGIWQLLELRWPALAEAAARQRLAAAPIDGPTLLAIIGGIIRSVALCVWLGLLPVILILAVARYLSEQHDAE